MTIFCEYPTVNYFLLFSLDFFHACAICITYSLEVSIKGICSHILSVAGYKKVKAYRIKDFSRNYFADVFHYVYLHYTHTCLVTSKVNVSFTL